MAFEPENAQYVDLFGAPAPTPREIAQQQAREAAKQGGGVPLGNMFRQRMIDQGRRIDAMQQRAARDEEFRSSVTKKLSDLGVSPAKDPETAADLVFKMAQDANMPEAAQRALMFKLSSQARRRAEALERSEMLYQDRLGRAALMNAQAQLKGAGAKGAKEPAEASPEQKTFYLDTMLSSAEDSKSPFAGIAANPPFAKHVAGQAASTEQFLLENGFVDSQSTARTMTTRMMAARVRGGGTGVLGVGEKEPEFFSAPDTVFDTWNAGAMGDDEALTMLTQGFPPEIYPQSARAIALIAQGARQRQKAAIEGRPAPVERRPEPSIPKEEPPGLIQPRERPTVGLARIKAAIEKRKAVADKSPTGFIVDDSGNRVRPSRGKIVTIEGQRYKVVSSPRPDEVMLKPMDGPAFLRRYRLFPAEAE